MKKLRKTLNILHSNLNSIDPELLTSESLYHMNEKTGEMTKIAEVEAKGEWDFPALLKYHKGNSGATNEQNLPASMLKRESSGGRMQSPKRG